MAPSFINMQCQSQDIKLLIRSIHIETPCASFHGLDLSCSSCYLMCFVLAQEHEMLQFPFQLPEPHVAPLGPEPQPFPSFTSAECFPPLVLLICSGQEMSLSVQPPHRAPPVSQDPSATLQGPVQMMMAWVNSTIAVTVWYMLGKQLHPASLLSMPHCPIPPVNTTMEDACSIGEHKPSLQQFTNCV
jgi:hypothetical protein